jgi:hypothetical protein
MFGSYGDSFLDGVGMVLVGMWGGFLCWITFVGGKYNIFNGGTILG